MDNEKKIKITADGPYIVSGGLPLAKEIVELDNENEPEKYRPGDKYPEQETYALCRCGQSKNMPFCDGTHSHVKFDGTETASKKKFNEQAVKISGPELDLMDASNLCSSARFCHRGGGTWALTENSDDYISKELAIKEAGCCPSGRLVTVDKITGQPIESKFDQSITLIEDPQAHASGPIWVKGGVPIESSDGDELEIRNRVALCRCGQSNNKPYCDGNHIRCRFNDGDESLK
jgi:CDGSH-type Zn-finger protein